MMNLTTHAWPRKIILLMDDWTVERASYFSQYADSNSIIHTPKEGITSSPDSLLGVE